MVNCQRILVSIITATYNADKYLGRCIESVLSQDYNNIEYLVIDGGSTDDTISIIKTYEFGIKYWISEPDNGIYDAWNKGIEKANGEWIVFIGADDELMPDAIQSYVNHIIEHPNFDCLEFISSRIDLVDENSKYIDTVGSGWNWTLFRKKMITWHVGTFHARSLFIKYGLFDTSYKISGDYEFLLRAKGNLRSSYFEKVTAKMRVGGISSVNLIKASSETYEAKIKNNIMPCFIGKVLKIIDLVRLSLRNK